MIRSRLIKQLVEIEIRLQIVEAEVGALRARVTALASSYREPPPKPPPDEQAA
jgi:hypothetical protein